MEELKNHWGRYLKGAIGGAIVILILGFAAGPLTTNASAEKLALAAAQNRDTTFCVANALKLVADGDHAAPASTSEKTDLAKASLASLLPEVKFANAQIRDCTRAFPKDF